MSIKKPSIAAIAGIIAGARSEGNAATADMIAHRLAEFFHSQNKFFNKSHFVAKCGAQEGPSDAVDGRIIQEAQQAIEGQKSLPGG